MYGYFSAWRIKRDGLVGAFREGERARQDPDAGNGEKDNDGFPVTNPGSGT